MGSKIHITDEKKRAVKRTLIMFIKEYFHDDKKFWLRRQEPYIYYKHMFRKFALGQIGVIERLRDIEQEIANRRPDNSTIANSRDIDPTTFPLSSDDMREIIVFLNKHYNINVQQQAKTNILKHINNGYTKSDVARHCLVHIEAIERVLNDKEIPHDILKQMEKEL